MRSAVAPRSYGFSPVIDGTTPTLSSQGGGAAQMPIVPTCLAFLTTPARRTINEYRANDYNVSGIYNTTLPIYSFIAGEVYQS